MAQKDRVEINGIVHVTLDYQSFVESLDFALDTVVVKSWVGGKL